MLEITPFSTACVTINKTLEYVPLASSAVSLIDLFLKYAVKPCRNEKVLKKDHYFTYIENKSTLRTTLLLVPVLGNLVIAASDCYYSNQAEEFIWAANALTRPEEASDAALLELQAANYGSLEGKYKFGLRIWKGPGMKQHNLEIAKEFLRDAASQDHKKALIALAELEEAGLKED